jgi:hypothetical protein|tara:strand:+ start:116 stop:319 length:204 start_codon:yes stop_codon:yes gene_type:complete
MKTFLLQVATVLIVLSAIFYAIVISIDIPDVLISNTSGECVTVLNYKEDDKYSCMDMPSKYNMIWVK